MLTHRARGPCACAGDGSEQRRAVSCAVLLQQDWAQEEDGDGDEEGSSSDGGGSSYFSGERLDQTLSSTASPMHSQQSLTGQLDRASLVRSLPPLASTLCSALHGEESAVIDFNSRPGGPLELHPAMALLPALPTNSLGAAQAERMVVLAEPVYPADSPARSTHSASRAGSTSGDLGSLGRPSTLAVDNTHAGYAAMLRLPGWVLDSFHRVSHAALSLLPLVTLSRVLPCSGIIYHCSVNRWRSSPVKDIVELQVFCRLCLALQRLSRTLRDLLQRGRPRA